MRRSRAFPAGALCLTAAVLFFAETAMLRTARIVRFDAAVIEAARRLEGPAVTGAMKTFTFLGSPTVVTVIGIAIALLLYLGLRRRAEALLFAATLAASGPLNALLKLVVHRARPDTHRLIPITGLSFPSGHAMGAFTLYGLLVYLLYRRVRGLAERTALVAAGALMTLAIGFSRVYLGVHYPSDVLGGYLAGCAWLSFAVLLYGRLYKPAPRTVVK